MLPNVSGLRLGGPPSVSTGEFYPLSQPEVDALNAGGGQEAFTVEPFALAVTKRSVRKWPVTFAVKACRWKWTTLLANRFFFRRGPQGV